MDDPSARGVCTQLVRLLATLWAVRQAARPTDVGPGQCLGRGDAWPGGGGVRRNCPEPKGFLRLANKLKLAAAITAAFPQACFSQCSSSVQIIGCDDREQGPMTAAAALSASGPWRHVRRLDGARCSGTPSVPSTCLPPPTACSAIIMFSATGRSASTWPSSPPDPGASPRPTPGSTAA